MERRHFLKLFAAAPALVVPSLSTKNSLPSMILDGWGLRWRGWIKPSNQNILVGQWIAFPMSGEGWSVYSSYPGTTRAFYGDMLFDISYQEDQPRVTPDSSQENLDAAQLQAFERLRDYLKKVGAPPLRYERVREFEYGESL